MSSAKTKRPSRYPKASQSAFTIVELLIVIVVIAVLAAIATVAYRGIQDRAEESMLQSDLTQAAKQLAMSEAITGSYPSDEATANDHISASSGVSFQYSADNSSFCLSATKGDNAYHITQSGTPKEGLCPDHSAPGGGSTIADGSHMQTITSANCPATRTRAVDARDGRTYWVQQMDDGKCWMLTNLAYGGGGTATYGDTKPVAEYTGTLLYYDRSHYFVPPGSNHFTTQPTNPSTATDGNGQYGYLYNWCAAMGGQLGTSACARAVTPVPNPDVSICPHGWRLPSISRGEIVALNNAVNSGSTSTDAGYLNTWLGQRGGYWWGSLAAQGNSGHYWTSDQYSDRFAHYLRLASREVRLSPNSDKYNAFSFRCVAT